MSDTLDLAAIKARHSAANATVDALCDGRERWVMRVPADESRDPDLVISAALADIPILRVALLEREAEVERLTAERDALRAAVGQVASKAERTAYAATEDEGHVEPEAWRAVAADLRAALSDVES